MKVSDEFPTYRFDSFLLFLPRLHCGSILHQQILHVFKSFNFTLKESLCRCPLNRHIQDCICTSTGTGTGSLTSGKTNLNGAQPEVNIASQATFHLCGPRTVVLFLIIFREGMVATLYSHRSPQHISQCLLLLGFRSSA